MKKTMATKPKKAAYVKPATTGMTKTLTSNPKPKKPVKISVTTLPTVTVTGKRKPTVTKPVDNNVYLISEGRNKQAQEVTKAQYNMYKGAKTKYASNDPKLKTVNTGYGATSMPGYKKMK